MWLSTQTVVRSISNWWSGDRHKQSVPFTTSTLEYTVTVTTSNTTTTKWEKKQWPISVDVPFKLGFPLQNPHTSLSHFYSWKKSAHFILLVSGHGVCERQFSTEGALYACAKQNAAASPPLPQNLHTSAFSNNPGGRVKEQGNKQKHTYIPVEKARHLKRDYPTVIAPSSAQSGQWSASAYQCLSG